MSMNTSYRTLFYLAALAVVALSGITWYVVRREQGSLDEAKHHLAKAEQMLHDPRWVNPVRLDPQRDHGFSFIVENYGFKYKGVTGNIIDDYVLVYGGWEKDLMFFMTDYLKAANDPRAAVLDVGANTGYHALALAQHAQTVHAFEPYPPVIGRLKEMIQLNDARNIVVHEVGLGDRDEEKTFYAPTASNHGDGTFQPDFKIGGDRQVAGKFKIVRGDDWVKSQDVPAVTLVKVDVEGFEKEVLQGLRQLLEKHRPLTIIEVSRPPEGKIASFEELQALLPPNYGYYYRRKSPLTLWKGDYDIADFAAYAPEFYRSGLQVDVIAYPLEKKAMIPTARSAAAGGPASN
jgi:FkbM family methyltransferase